MKKIISIILAILMFNSILSGCSKDAPDKEDPGQISNPAKLPEHIDFPNLSDTLPGIDNLVLSGDVLYFTSSTNIPDDSFFIGTALYSINIDGTNLTELSDYKEVYNPPSEALGGESIVVSMCVDKTGNIWVAEAVYYYVFDLSANMSMEDSPKSQIWEKRLAVGTDYTVRKLDATGKEIHTLDLNIPATMQEMHYIESIVCDGRDNIYIGSTMGIFVFDNEGKNLFDLAFSGYYRRLITLQDGTVAAPNMAEMIHIIDFDNKAWGNIIRLPENAYNIFSGNDDYSVVYNDGGKLYGIKTGTDETELILDFAENSVNARIIDNLLFMPDGQIMMTNKEFISGNDKTELIVFTVIPPGFLSQQGIIELTFAVVNPNDDNGVNEAVMRFNNKSTTHRIKIIDYTSGSWQASANKLALEVTTGNAPDIICIPFIPYQQWAVKGVFVDLYPYIDADPELNRSDYFESILSCADVAGGLYGVPMPFAISSLIGNPSVIGDSISWTWDEFMSVINANPQADYPIGAESRGRTGLYYWLQGTIGNYVDWVSGTAHFDRGDFAQLLELCKNYTAYDYDNYQSTQQLVSSGRQLMNQSSFYTFMWYHFNREDYGDEFIFKGYPTENGSGIYAVGGTEVSINSNCRDIDAAWEFVRIFLTEDWQRTRVDNHFMFPTNKNVFNEKLEEAMTPPEEEQWVTWTGAPFMINAALTQKEADKILATVNAISSNAGLMTQSLEDIIMESAEDYFEGRITVEDAVRIIQNRASIYMAEQTG